jgi:hypothetical protein
MLLLLCVLVVQGCGHRAAPHRLVRPCWATAQLQAALVMVVAVVTAVLQRQQVLHGAAA